MDIKILRGLCEAYSGVYTPQELTEEQIWEEVENWVNSLIEEGYDLSDYSWEDMYEAYLEEAPQGDIGARFGRGLVGALRDLPSGLQGQLTGKDNAALQRQRQRGQNLETLLKTGKLPSNNPGTAKQVSTPRPAAAAPVAQTRPAAAAPVAQTRPAAAAPVAQPKPTTPAPGSQQPSRPATPAPADAKPAASPVAQPKPTTPAPGTKAAGPESIKPKTPNPLLAGGDIRRMQQASQMRQKGIDITSDQIAAAERTKPTTTKKESTEWGSTSKLVDDIANLYQSVYEAKKVDQDEDGDNDFADVRIARLIASGMSKEEAIAKVKNKPYNEEYISEDPVQNYRDMKRSKENASGMRGPELSHSTKPVSSGSIKPQPRSREFSHGTSGSSKSTPLKSVVKGGLSMSYVPYGDMVNESAKRTSKKIRGAKDPKAEMAGRSDAGKRISGDEKTGPRYYTLGRSRGAVPDAPTQPGARPVNTPKLSSSEKKYSKYQHGQTMKGIEKGYLKVGGSKGLPEEVELWVQELINEGYDLSDYTWDEIVEIYEDYKPWDFGPKQKAQAKHSQLVQRKEAGGSPRGTATRANKIASVGREMRTTLDKNSAATGANPAKQGLQPATQRHTAAAMRGAGGGTTATKAYNVKPLKSSRGGSSSLGGVGNASGTQRYTPGAGGRYGLAGIGLADEFELWVQELINEGYELDNWTDEELVELYIEIFG